MTSKKRPRRGMRRAQSSRRKRDRLRCAIATVRVCQGPGREGATHLAIDQLPYTIHFPRRYRSIEKRFKQQYVATTTNARGELRAPLLRGVEVTLLGQRHRLKSMRGARLAKRLQRWARTSPRTKRLARAEKRARRSLRKGILEYAGMMTSVADWLGSSRAKGRTPAQREAGKGLWKKRAARLNQAASDLARPVIKSAALGDTLRLCGILERHKNASLRAGARTLLRRTRTWIGGVLALTHIGDVGLSRWRRGQVNLALELLGYRDILPPSPARLRLHRGLLHHQMTRETPSVPLSGHTCYPSLLDLSEVLRWL